MTTSRPLGTTALALVLGLIFGTAAAALAIVRRLDHPLPASFRARAETMVRTLRPRDAEAASAALKTLEFAERHPEWVFLRVEAGCRAGRCMTIIARADETSMTPELLLNVGPSVLFNDYSFGLWGLNTWSDIVFDGAGSSAVTVTRRGDHWVVGACSECKSWADVKEPEPTPPEPPPREPERFEDFRRFIDGERR